MRQRSFEKLSQNLDTILKQYRVLLDCLKKEKEFLIQNDIEKINQTNLLKEKVLTEIKHLEVTRINCSQELARLVGSNSEQPRLLEIAQKMPGAEGDRLRIMHSALELVLKNVIELNKENASYAQAALSTVNSAMENIKETLMGQKTYQKKGNYQQSYDKSGHLVSKEA